MKSPLSIDESLNDPSTQDLPQIIQPNNQNDEKGEKTSIEDIETSNDADEQQYPSKVKLIFIVLSLSLCMFLVGLDNTIISSAIPKITDDFHALEDVGWYASAYMLTVCAFQLMWGKLFTFYTIKWVYLSSLFIFELGSLICGVAPTSTALIIGRAIAGIGGSGVTNGSFLLIAYSVPPRQRPALIGALGSMYGFSAIAGPLIGGAFTDNAKLTWRWCFYINLPLGFVAGLVILFFVSSFKGSKAGKLGFMNQLEQMDVPGTLCLLPGIICLLLALQWGGTKYPWSNGRIIALFVVAFAILLVFGFIQLRSGELATVPKRIFCNRNIWGSSLFGSCICAAFFTMLYYVCTVPGVSLGNILTENIDPNLVPSYKGS
jgi:MFS family permease